MSVWQLKETNESQSVQPFLVLHQQNSAATSEIWQRQIVYHDVYNVFGKIGLATLIIHFLHFLSLKSNPNVCVSNKSWPPFSWTEERKHERPRAFRGYLLPSDICMWCFSQNLDKMFEIFQKCFEKKHLLYNVSQNNLWKYFRNISENSRNVIIWRPFRCKKRHF